MKYIVAGTNRPGSNTLGVAKIVKTLYKELGEDVELIDLAQVPLDTSGPVSYKAPHPAELKRYIDYIDNSSGLVMVVPEYNGSYPGILKLFIDHWSYPRSFEKRPVCFIGLGGRYGGLRSVEHLQQVFGYRNGYIFPDRVFLMNIEKNLKEGKLDDAFAMSLLNQQAKGFQSFVNALSTAGLAPQ